MKKMRRRNVPQKYFLGLLVFLFIAITAYSADAEVIRSFQTDVHLQKDTTLDITETIVYDFEGAEKHGIFRDIPIRYERHGNTYSYKFDIVSITDENGKSLKYKDSNQGENRHIRIGDPDQYVTGQRTYKIHYTVLRAVNFFDGKPEVYWNTTGNKWEVPINKAEARFFPPEGTQLDTIKTDSFWGAFGSKDRASSKIVEDGGYISFFTENLQPKQGLTFVAGLPEGSVNRPSNLLLFWWFFRDWWAAFLLPIAAFSVLLNVYLRTGRDADGGRAIAVEWYPPKDLSPAEVGTLVDEKCDMEDILSTLLDLAARGYIQIDEEKKKVLFKTTSEYTFIRNAPDPAGDVLAPHEKIFLDGLFKSSGAGFRGLGAALGAINDAHKSAKNSPEQDPAERVTDFINTITAGTVSPKPTESAEPAKEETPPSIKPQPTNLRVKLSDLTNNFYKVIPGIKSSIYESLTFKKFFVRNPSNTRNTYKGAGIVIGFLGIFLVGVSMSWAIGLIATGGITFLFNKAMPAKTAAGSRKLRECLGFARFVKMVEKPRLKMMQDEDPQVFGRLLPYAVALGVADEWAKGFEGLLSEPPDWYSSSAGYGAGFSTGMFMRDMRSGMNSMSSTMQSAPSSAGSGGSGFSGGGAGGGGGGGGGGSW